MVPRRHELRVIYSSLDDDFRASIVFDDLPRIGVYEPFRDFKAMSGAQEALKLLLPFFGRRGFAGKWPQALSPGEVLGCCEAAFGHMFLGRNGVGIANAAGAQVFVQPPLAIAAADKRPAAAFRKLRIVDIAEFCELFGERIYVGRAFVTPTTLADFAGQIGGEFGLCCGIFADIMQGKPAQSLVIQRRRRLFVWARFSHALFLPQSGRNLNWYRRVDPHDNKNVTWACRSFGPRCYGITYERTR